MTCFIIVNQLVLWDPPVNYYSISRRQGSTSNPKHSVSRHQLAVSSYERFHYHHHFQGTSENWTVCCCVRHSLTFLPPPAPPIRTLDTAATKNVHFDSWRLTWTGNICLWLYTVSQKKTSHFNFRHNFAICWDISTIFEAFCSGRIHAWQNIAYICKGLFMW